MKRYPKELHQRAIAMYRETGNMSAVARQLNVSDYTVQRWLHKAGIKRYNFLNNELPSEKIKTESTINPLLKVMAGSNDLSQWQGRDITTLTPREIYDFLRAINLQGELISKTKITI